METIVAQLLSAVLTLTSLVGALQADVNNLKAHNGFSAPTTFGAAAGPEMFSPDGCISVNGARTCYARMKMAQATSTPCSLKTPTASSTFEVVPAATFTGNAYANSFEWGWAVNNFSTTTSLARLDNVSAATPSIVATTSQSKAIAGNNDGVLPPNTWVNFRIGTSSNASMDYAPVGYCSAAFRVI
jgi:hypothetical protein